LTADELWEMRQSAIKCARCGGALRETTKGSGRREYDPESRSIDHINPFSMGGRHVRENIQIVHERCNQEAWLAARRAA
jgi:5-methylcytosine-specific restriction endonuclease McrA